MSSLASNVTTHKSTIASSKRLFTLLISLLATVNLAFTQSTLCDPATPSHIVDLSTDPSGSWFSPFESRVGLCCSSSWPDRCVRFEVTLHPEAVGIVFTIETGAKPAGSLFYQVGCGPPVRVGEPICLSGIGPHTITFCKPGSNKNSYSIQSIPGAVSAPADTTKPGCTVGMFYSGVNLYEDSIVWNDITSGTGYYNAFLSCITACDTNFFSPPIGITDSLVLFEACAIPNTSICSGITSRICDTFEVFIRPPIQGVINPFPAFVCDNEAGVTLTSSTNDFYDSLAYAWYDGADGTGSQVGTDSSYFATNSGSFSVIITDLEFPDCSIDTVNSIVTVEPSPVLTTLPALPFCAGEPTTLVTSGATNYSWSPSTGISCDTCPISIVFPPGNMVYVVTGSFDNGCSSTDTVVVSMNTAYFSIQAVDICENDSFYVAGSWQTSSGSYTDSLVSTDGCDSIIDYELSVLPETVNSITYEICFGGTVTLPNGVTTSSPGTYSDTLIAPNGCNLIFRYEVLLIPPEVTNVDIDICDGDSTLLAGGSWVDSVGVFSDTLTSASGCDSIVVSSVSLLSAFDENQQFYLCTGDSVFLPGGYWVNSAGVYVDTLSFSGGCLARMTTEVFIDPTYSISNIATICQGESYSLPGGAVVYVSGVYIDSLKSSTGCDSVRITNLTVTPTYNDTIYASVCNGDSVLIDAFGWIGASGVYSSNLSSSFSCDSNSTYIVTVDSAYRDTSLFTLCLGDSILLSSGAWVSTAGTYLDMDYSVLGCDSSTISIVNLFSAVSYADTTWICPTDSAQLPNGAYTSIGGDYTDTFSTAYCDSIINTFIGIIPDTIWMQTVTLCQPDSFQLPGGYWSDTAGIYKDTLISANGCDSILITTIGTSPLSNDTLYQNACSGDSFLLVNGAYTSSDGIFTSSFITINGCDSFITEIVSFTNSFFYRDTVSICEGDSVGLPDGSWTTSGGHYSFTMPTANGCDSTLERVVLKFSEDHTHIIQHHCEGDSFFVPTLGYVVGAGNYFVNFTNSNGCDSLLRLEVIVHATFDVSLFFSLCDGDSALLTGGGYTSIPGVYVDTIWGAGGCQSTITTTVESDTSFTQVVNAAICEFETYTLPDGVVVSSPGIYTTYLISSSGCDSVITTSLSVSDDFLVFSTIQICEGDSVLLPGGQVVYSGGIYTDTLSSSGDCAGVVQTAVIVNSIDTVFENYSLCFGDSLLLPDGSYVDSAGTYEVHLVSSRACDSIVFAGVSILPELRDSIWQTICEGDSILTAAGLWVHAAGDYSDTLTAANGCDSILVSALRLNPSYMTDRLYELCSGDSVMLPDGSFSTDTGNYSFHYTTSNLCDSVINIEVTEGVTFQIYQDTSICVGDSVYLAGAWQTVSGVHYDSLGSSAGICETILTTNLSVIPIAVLPVDQSICPGDTAYMEISAIGPYQWLPSDFIDCENCFGTNAFPSSTTIYTVFYTGCDGERESAEATVNVHVPPLVDAGSDLTVPPGSEVELTAEAAGSNPLQFSWSSGSTQLCTDCESWTVVADATSVYTVTVVDANGCMANDDLRIGYSDYDCAVEAIEIPNFLSPNGDGNNDEFVVKLADWADFKLVRIYNRWGELIFESDDPNFGWNGTFRGKPMNSGVFVYYVEGSCESDLPFRRVGNVTLSR